MGAKFIPNGDVAFAEKAHGFACAIASDPQRFALTRADADALSAAAARYRAALLACRSGGTRSQVTTHEKKRARAEAERIMRRLAHLVRASSGVAPDSKVMLGLRERPAKASKPQTCPQEPPRLRFVRALHESGATPMHELEFLRFDMLKTGRPPGAVRIELFVDLVPPDEPIPPRPGANHGGRPWYLRSYTRSPIVLAPPMARVPMRVVYWARWADAAGNVGPFSATAVGWVEGGSTHNLPGAPAMKLGNFHSPILPMMQDAEQPTTPAGRDPSYHVAVLDAQYEYFNPQEVETTEAAALPAPSEREPRRLEGPPSSEAA